MGSDENAIDTALDSIEIGIDVLGGVVVGGEGNEIQGCVD